MGDYSLPSSSVLWTGKESLLAFRSLPAVGIVPSGEKRVSMLCLRIASFQVESRLALILE